MRYIDKILRLYWQLFMIYWNNNVEQDKEMLSTRKKNQDSGLVKPKNHINVRQNNEYYVF